MKETKILHAIIDRKVHDTFKAIAAARGKMLKELIEEVLRQYINKVGGKE